MAAAQCIDSCRYWWRAPVNAHIKCQNGEKCDCRWDFHTHQSLKVVWNAKKQKKTRKGYNALSMRKISQHLWEMRFCSPWFQRVIRWVTIVVMSIKPSLDILLRPLSSSVSAHRTTARWMFLHRQKISRFWNQPTWNPQPCHWQRHNLFPILRFDVNINRGSWPLSVSQRQQSECVPKLSLLLLTENIINILQ